MVGRLQRWPPVQWILSESAHQQRFAFTVHTLQGNDTVSNLRMTYPYFGCQDRMCDVTPLMTHIQRLKFIDFWQGILQSQIEVHTDQIGPTMPYVQALLSFDDPRTVSPWHTLTLHSPSLISDSFLHMEMISSQRIKMLEKMLEIDVSSKLTNVFTTLRCGPSRITKISC